ncbi:methionine--tRNA ligase [Streptomyces alkaliphilus]|uniref:methionine--tRNA ligase n=1 Tax=Streptomyces alkaliphilus TaxID=1472722 RepID=UPI001180AD81|nr:methionine--tRNA ligase [Streptomyces alkaliphilus]MQS06972.1 methionine--tRNA ligase [Streptomyces alkaliphilus]
MTPPDTRRPPPRGPVPAERRPSFAGRISDAGGAGRALPWWRPVVAHHPKLGTSTTMAAASFISTTIPYVNARPHVGHALEFVQSDAFARYAAMAGRDVYFLSGSDENSLKNVLAADKEGISARELVDRNVVFFEKMVGDLEIGLTRFIRTSVDADHLEGAAEIWRRIAASGDLYTKDYEGLYCVGCEQFYAPAELVDGRCPEHLVEPERISERNYFFRLSRYQDRLLELLESGELRIVPETRLNEVTSFVRAGLADISISRSMERARGWGIRVPEDPEQVMYVWIDALTNYINALGWTRGDEHYERFWENAEHRVHVVGKGVTRFHAVYWPAMLLSAGLPLPTEIVVHGYITASGQKLSKSLGNVVDPSDLIDRFGTDAVRYFLLADVSPFGDADFSEERLVQRYNTDLANGLGNLLSRVTSMIVRYRNGAVPAPGPVERPEEELVAQLLESDRGLHAAMAGYDHREALAKVWDLVRRTNAYVDERAPWHLAKAGDDASNAALDTTLHHLAGAVRQIGRLLQPFLPRPAAAVLEALDSDPVKVPGADRWLEDLTGTPVSKAGALFPRIEVPAED